MSFNDFTLADLASTDPITKALPLTNESHPGKLEVQSIRKLDRQAVQVGLVQQLNMSTPLEQVAVKRLLDLVFKPSPYQYDHTTGRLDMSQGRVLSQALRALSFALPGTFIDNVSQLLLQDREIASVITLDLHGNSLRDEDLPTVVQIVRLCRPLIVNLRSNRFGYGYPNPETAELLCQICKVDSVVFVDIAGEMFTGSDWQPLYQVWERHLWTKLVFIPLHWLAGHDWEQTDICGEHRTLSKETHRLYYYFQEYEPVFDQQRLAKVLSDGSEEWTQARAVRS
ncbi:hypothetical protein CAOG_06857 [Capsaspora owczarzaki ATCC 30864]|nr:hypothetical protein CAOG_06857 [Capsaspora owczarzaki ATCC 30864]|eukprot:XP_004344478.1 hypothetical protein CAOG_06857 [Capsaspora owczarzaki ATCC 30864]